MDKTVDIIHPIKENDRTRVCQGNLTQSERIIDTVFYL